MVFRSVLSCSVQSPSPWRRADTSHWIAIVGNLKCPRSAHGYSDPGQSLEARRLKQRKESSGGETRTLNLAAPREPKPYQYPSAKSQEDEGID